MLKQHYNEVNEADNGCNPYYNGMLKQLYRISPRSTISCNPYYNGMLKQPRSCPRPLSWGCNPYYNGMLKQLGTGEHQRSAVVILIIMECLNSVRPTIGE